MEMGDIIVQTERLRLTEMLDTDQEEVLRLYIQANAVVAALVGEGGVIHETIRNALWAEMRSDTLNCMIRDMAGTFIGRVCMQHISDEYPEVGIELFEQYRNRGYGPEVLTVFIPWFKSNYGKEKIRVRIEPDNKHSQHVFEKLGAVYVASDTALREETVRRIREVMPDADVSDLETLNISAYYL